MATSIYAEPARNEQVHAYFDPGPLVLLSGSVSLAPSPTWMSGIDRGLTWSLSAYTATGGWTSRA